MIEDSVNGQWIIQLHWTIEEFGGMVARGPGTSGIKNGEWLGSPGAISIFRGRSGKMDNASREEELTEESCTKPNCSQTWLVVNGNLVLLHAPAVGCCIGCLVLANQRQSKESKEDGL